MSNQIILGDKESTAMNYIAPAIRLHHGEILWISSLDDATTIRLKNVIDGSIKIQVIIDEQFSVSDLQNLKKKLHSILINKHALLIFEDAASTFNDIFLDEAESIIKSNCAHMFVYENEKEMREFFTNRLITEAGYEVVYADETKNYLNQLAM